MDALKNIAPAILAVTLFCGGSLYGDVCTFAPPKPLSHVCGLVVDYKGHPIPAARISVSQDGKEVATERTSDAGEFDFRNLQNGRYDVLLESKGFRQFQFTVTVKRTQEVCTRPLRVKLSLGFPLHDCEEIQVVKKSK